MTENPFVESLRRMMESARDGGLSALENQQTQLEKQHRAMQAVIDRTADGASEVGDVVVTMTGAQQVVAIAIRGRLAVQPSDDRIAQQMREAWTAATMASAEALRQAFADEFGIEIPGPEADLSKLAEKAAADAQVHLDALAKNELLGSMVKDMVARAKEFEQAEFVGTEGCAVVTVNGHNELVGITLDWVQVRKLDSGTITEHLLAATKEAQQKRLQAQQDLGQASMPDELKPERLFAAAEDLMYEVRKRLAYGGL